MYGSFWCAALGEQAGDTGGCERLCLCFVMMQQFGIIAWFQLNSKFVFRSLKRLRQVICITIYCLMHIIATCKSMCRMLLH